MNPPNRPTTEEICRRAIPYWDLFPSGDQKSILKVIDHIAIEKDNELLALHGSINLLKDILLTESIHLKNSRASLALAVGALKLTELSHKQAENSKHKENGCTDICKIVESCLSEESIQKEINLLKSIDEIIEACDYINHCPECEHAHPSNHPRLSKAVMAYRELKK